MRHDRSCGPNCPIVSLLHRRVLLYPLGNADPLADIVSAQRWRRMRQSKSRVIEKSGASQILSLAMEQSEGRYILSGDRDGNIAVHDLYSPRRRIRRGEANAGLFADRNENTAQNGNSMNDSVSVFTPIIQLRKPLSHNFSVTSVEWFPSDTGIFATTSYDQTAKIWDANALEAVCTFHMDAHVNHGAFNRGGLPHLFACATSEQRVRLCDMRTGGNAHVLAGHESGVLCVQWSPVDPHVLVSGSVDGTVRCWDIRRGGESACLAILDRQNTSLMLGGSSHVPTKRKAGVVRSQKSHNSPVNGLAVTPDGAHVLSLSLDSSMQLWDLQDHTNRLVNYGNFRNSNTVSRFPVIVGGGNVQTQNYGVASTWHTSANNALVYVPDMHEVKCFDIFSGRKLSPLYGGYTDIVAISIHPFEEMIVAAGSGPEIMCFTPGGKYDGGKIHNNNKSGNGEGPSEAQANNGLTSFEDDRDNWSSDSE